LGGVLLTTSAIYFTREVDETQKTLERARDAIMGFALRAERLPCPAAPGTTGVESFVSPGALPAPVAAPAFNINCSSPLNGFVPALSLGIGPTDPQGYLLDAWGNRIRYAVTTWASGAVDITQCP